ncbi:MAG: YcxB family protein [Oscillospiraceae bacterium]|nr:YcxB family protein [Oscillospiraceae bacterium]
MTFKTSLDAHTFYHALYIQNDIYSKKIMLWIRITLIMIPLAITLPMSFVDPQTDWFIRAFLCATVVGVHGVISKKSREKMLADTAQNIYNSNGGDLNMEYRIADDAFYATGPDGKENEFSYRAIEHLAESNDAFVIIMSRDFMHAIRKSDLSLDERQALAVKFYAKSGLKWRPYKNI